MNARKISDDILQEKLQKIARLKEEQSALQDKLVILNDQILIVTQEIEDIQLSQKSVDGIIEIEMQGHFSDKNDMPSVLEEKEFTGNPWSRPLKLFKKPPSKKHVRIEEPAIIDGIVTNVHTDDIHALFTWSNYIISGSKDSSVRLFDENGIRLDVLSSEKSPNYTNWVTSMDVFNDGSILVGYRDGKLKCFDMDKKNYYSPNLFDKKFEPLYDARNYSSEEITSGLQSRFRIKNSKQRNNYRVTGIKCMNPDSRNEFNALVGMSQIFFQVSFDKKEIMRKFWLPEPDWVYGFEQLSSTTFVVIHGASLSLFNLGEGKSSNLIFKNKFHNPEYLLCKKLKINKLFKLFKK